MKPTSSKIGLQFHNLKTGCQQERKVLKLTVKDVPRRLNYQIWEYKQLNSHAADKFTLFLSCIML